MADNVQPPGPIDMLPRSATRLPLGVISSVLLLLLLVVLCVKIAFGAVMSATMFSFPFQFDESEGMIVAETMLIDRGVNIFEVPTPSLFVAAPYPRSSIC